MLSSAFTWDNANVLAVIARDAYLEPKEFKKKWKKAKFIEGDDTQCYVWPVPPPTGAGNSNQLVVVFRGTEPRSLEDIKTDLKFKKTASDGGGEVHYGFKDALDDVWEKLHKTFKNNTLYFCGHSLGGALATLAAGRVNTEKCQLYTFGSPKCVDQKWISQQVYSSHAWRFRNNNDVVTKVPFMGYKHFGHIMYFDYRGDWKQHFSKWYLAGQWCIGNAIGLINLRWDSFGDHSIENYIDNILKHCEKTKDEDLPEEVE
jgi:triacylglycerol lipase